jgi:hypothetical protein
MAPAPRTAHGDLVQYLSPFDTPRWLSRLQAEGFLERDERRWLRLEDLGMVSDSQLAAGPPHIEPHREAR